MQEVEDDRKHDAQEVTDEVRFDSENTCCGFDITSPRTSCPAVNGSDLLMAKVVSMTGSTRAEAQLDNRQQSSTCVLMQTSLSLYEQLRPLLNCSCHTANTHVGYRGSPDALPKQIQDLAIFKRVGATATNGPCCCSDQGVRVCLGHIT